MSSLKEHGYKCRNCRGNFIFVETKKDSHNVAARLEKEHKVLVKTFSNDLLMRYLRVSIGSVSAMDIFLKALYEVDV